MFVCQKYPEGLALRTQESKEVFTLNGIQTQSAATQSLLPHLRKLRNAGIDPLVIVSGVDEAAPPLRVVGRVIGVVRADPVPLVVRLPALAPAKKLVEPYV